MRTMIYKLFAFVAIIIIVLAPWRACNAESNRSDRMELGASLWFLDGASDSIGSVKISEDDWTLYGVTLGKNINENLNINTEIVYGNIDIVASGLPAGYDVSGDQTTLVWLVNLDYNFLNGPLTPYVTGGLGFGYSSGDVELCTPTTTIKDDVDASGLAYTLGVGGRWDITDNIFAKVAYRILWDDSGDDRSGFGVSAGFLF